MRRGIYYEDERTLERRIADIKTDARITEANRQLVLRFIALCKAQQLSIKRVVKTAWMVRILAVMAGELDFNKMGRDECVDLVNLISQQGNAESTANDYRAMLKKFLRYAIGAGTTPQWARWIPVGKVRITKDPASMLTEEDVKRLLQAQEALGPWASVRNKAMIALLYESGVRAGELLGMRIRDVDARGEVWVVTVYGKTGQRSFPIYASVPYFLEYLNIHPRALDLDAPMWCSFLNASQSISHRELLVTLQRSFKRAGISKPAKPKHFRDSAVTRDAAFMSDQQLKAKFGWTPGSKELETYSHIGLDALDTVLRTHYGLAKAPAKPALVPRACLCGAATEAHKKFCADCGRALPSAAEPPASTTNAEYLLPRDVPETTNW